MEWNRFSTLVSADSSHAQRVRRRVAVGTALAMLLAALLVILGLGTVVAASALFAACMAVGSAAVRGLQANWEQLQAGARRLGAVLSKRSATAASVARSCPGYLRRVARDVLAWLRPRVERLATSARTRARAAALTAERIGRMQRSIDLEREALRLNAAGTKRRRQGAHAAAVDLHRRALELLRDADDPRAVALTQNNLALALSRVGEVERAITLFEEAAATVGELGEHDHEGRIIANLGLTHCRHGQREQSANALRLALTKLRRDSSEYEFLEAELRRVS